MSSQCSGPTRIRHAASFLVVLMSAACGSAPASNPDKGSAGSSDAGVPFDASQVDASNAGDGSSSSGAMDSGPADGFWTAHRGVPASYPARQLFVFSDQRWVVAAQTLGGKDYVQDVYITADGGKTWTLARSGFLTDPTFTDPVNFLGRGPNGEAFAAWTHPFGAYNNPVCSDCSADAPGNAGDAFLLQYDWSTGGWTVVEQLPAADNYAARIFATASSFWYVVGGVYRHDGPGQWVAEPATNLGPVDSTAAPDGTLLSATPDDQGKLVEVTPGVGGVASDAGLGEGGAEAGADAGAAPDAWQTLYTCSVQERYETGAFDDQSRLYVSFGYETGDFALKRWESGTWVDLTSSLLPSRGNEPFSLSIGGSSVVVSSPPAPGADAGAAARIFLSNDYGATWHEHDASSWSSSLPDRPFDFDASGRVYFLAGTTVFSSPGPSMW